MRLTNVIVFDGSSSPINSVIDISSDNVLMLGGPGNDTFVYAGLGSSAIDGESGNDLLVGGAYNDILDGGPGNDTLIGGGGSDILIGGRGRDLFVVGRRDVIDDFQHGVDHIAAAYPFHAMHYDQSGGVLYFHRTVVALFDNSPHLTATDFLLI